MDTLQMRIHTELKKMSDLVALLEQEEALLLQAPRDEIIEEVARLASIKSQLLSQISTAERLNVSADSNAGTGQPLSPEFLAAKAELARATARAKTLNATNGTFLARHLALMQERLNILLQGHVESANPPIYNGNGELNRPSSVRGASA